jgi:hypothetical protein
LFDDPTFRREVIYVKAREALSQRRKVEGEGHHRPRVRVRRDKSGVRAIASAEKSLKGELQRKSRWVNTPIYSKKQDKDS